MVGWDGIEPPTPGFSVLRPSSNWPYAGVLPVPGLGTPAYGVGPVQRYGQVRRMSPGAGQNVEPRLLVVQIHEDPMWRGWAPRKRQDGQSSLRASGKTLWEDIAGSFGAACRYLRVHNFS